MSAFVIESSSTPTGTVTDINGRSYQTIKVGNIEWMAENLATNTKFNDGTSINEVQIDAQWAQLTTLHRSTLSSGK